MIALLLVALSAHPLPASRGEGTRVADARDPSPRDSGEKVPEGRMRGVTHDPWTTVPEILARIVAPEFPVRDFVITKYGAKGNGGDASTAIAKAIDACVKAGGGRVVVPKGDYVTGPIRLRSNVELHL